MHNFEHFSNIELYKTVLYHIFIEKGQKDYFRITFCLNLIFNKDVKGQKIACVGVEFVAFNVLFHTQFEQKVLGN